MKTILLVFFLAALPAFAQDSQSFLQKISGLWKVKGASASDLEAEHFEFFANGNLIFSINGGTKEKPTRTVLGRGHISILSSKGADSYTAEIFLDEEYSTNILTLKDGGLILYSINPKNQKPFEKFSMERTSKP